MRQLLFGRFKDFRGDTAVCAGGASQCASTAPKTALTSRVCERRGAGIAGWGLAAGAVSSLVMCLEGLGFHYLTAMAAHDQVEVILCRTLAEDGHVVSAESHGFAIFPALFQTFFQFCTVAPVEFHSVDPAAPRLSQHYFGTRQGSALRNSRHCCGGFSPLEVWLLLQLPGRSALLLLLLPPDVIIGPFRHSFRYNVTTQQ